MDIDLIPPSRPCNRKDSAEMREIITSSLRLDATALLAHAPERKVHQPLAVDVGINGLTKLRRCNSFKGGLLGFA
ncbi:hypothetical protein D3C75_1020950 [compost metagenome]